MFLYQAVVLMGKNTMMRKAIRGHLETNPDLERLMPHIKQNVGFVFTKMELLHVRDLLLSNKVKAPAKAGALAPVDVVVPAQNTGMGPEKTSFFQALAIPTKITKGTIEIIKDVDIIKAGDRVGMSEATLLNMLKISPFSYGLVISKVWISCGDLRIDSHWSNSRCTTAAVCLTLKSWTSLTPTCLQSLPLVWPTLLPCPWPSSEHSLDFLQLI